jgi:hypothetical protein
MHTEALTHTVIATGAGGADRFITFQGVQAVAASHVLGVARTDYVAGDAVPVDVIGIIAVKSGAAVARGDVVVPDANGRGIAGTDASVNKVGRALNAVTGLDQNLFVKL